MLMGEEKSKRKMEDINLPINESFKRCRLNTPPNESHIQTNVNHQSHYIQRNNTHNNQHVNIHNNQHVYLSTRISTRSIQPQENSEFYANNSELGKLVQQRFSNENQSVEQNNYLSQDDNSNDNEATSSHSNHYSSVNQMLYQLHLQRRGT
ncbi:hypothetical protein BC833DRAFT_612258 [Globomyces pollinis-pini]|nr:hypothetical protein BC833DRAFT_612258 [Globomyces pollinis-pini]